MIHSSCIVRKDGNLSAVTNQTEYRFDYACFRQMSSLPYTTLHFTRTVFRSFHISLTWQFALYTCSLQKEQGLATRQWGYKQRKSKAAKGMEKPQTFSGNKVPTHSLPVRKDLWTEKTSLTSVTLTIKLKKNGHGKPHVARTSKIMVCNNLLANPVLVLDGR
jgi:hypothetical protein